ncbi:MAG TPA: energy transducer TonB [Vicinamibacterales bacterium]|nr:energy transducer TonB [Vicinamibacterales bacterium]
MSVVLRLRWSRAWGLPIAAILCLAPNAAAQEPLAKAKALYDSAAYEDALTILTPDEAPEAQQYKALCLLALGRSKDAVGAVERLVTAEPTFEPSAQEVPPRFVALVSEAKRRLLPTLARRAFNEGRDQFKNGSREEARKSFDLVLTLTSDALFKQSSEADDLRTLASGFIELAEATAPPPPSAPVEVAAKPPEISRPTQTPEIVQPIVVKQFIPPFPSELNDQGGPALSIRVVIGVNGRVTGATVQQSAHPLYDRLVLQAARDWIYLPATLNGRPVTSEKVVTVQLR